MNGVFNVGNFVTHALLLRLPSNFTFPFIITLLLLLLWWWRLQLNRFYMLFLILWRWLICKLLIVGRLFRSESSLDVDISELS